MAVIKQPESNGFAIEALAPTGTFIATCLDVQDQFGVERPKFENPQEKEALDVTRFLFGFRGQDGRVHKVQSFEFRISGSPKSNLFKFLTSWPGQAHHGVVVFNLSRRRGAHGASSLRVHRGSVR